MQVFLPYPNLKRSVCCLDPKRLGNQVYRECLTLVRGGWANHPVARMWDGFHYSLARYALYGLDELERRGYRYPHHHETFLDIALAELMAGRIEAPPWLGDERLHSSHRAALLFKDSVWYSRFGWAERPAVPNPKGQLPYYWPKEQDYR